MSYPHLSDVCLGGLENNELSYPSLEKDLPLVIRPQKDNTFQFLNNFVAANVNTLKKSITEYGGLLLRGFNINNAENFEKILRLLQYNLFNNYSEFGGSPRNHITEYVFTSTELNNRLVLSPHTEMSYLLTRPKMISFFCLVEPLKYGETPIYNLKAACNDLLPEVKNLLQTKMFKTIRVFKKERSRWDMNFLKPWTEVFSTTEKSIVENKCNQLEVTCFWKENETLQTEIITPAIVKHPETGELSLTLQMLFESSLKKNPIRLHNRKNYITKLLYGLASTAFSKKIYMLLGDDTPISNSIVEHLDEVVWKHSKIFTWKKNDILILDNIFTGHARLTVIPPRKIAVALGDMYHV